VAKQTCQLCGKRIDDLLSHLDLAPYPHDPAGSVQISQSHPTEYQRVWVCSCGAIFFHDDPYSEHRYYDCPDRMDTEIDIEIDMGGHCEGCQCLT